MKPTRATVLAVIRRAPVFAELASSDDELLVMRAGLMPKTYLDAHFNRPALSRTQERAYVELLAALVKSGRIQESRTYYRANPTDRTMPIATDFDVAYPQNVPSRGEVRFTIYRRDRYALWYAAAKHDLSGSKGNTTSLALILSFWRLPRIQKAWRRYLATLATPYYKGKLPKEAR